jgi:hypothetical protein
MFNAYSLAIGDEVFWVRVGDECQLPSGQTPSVAFDPYTLPDANTFPDDVYGNVYEFKLPPNDPDELFVTYYLCLKRVADEILTPYVHVTLDAYHLPTWLHDAPDPDLVPAPDPDPSPSPSPSPSPDPGRRHLFGAEDEYAPSPPSSPSPRPWYAYADVKASELTTDEIERALDAALS